jgi:hypothetical protein
MITHTALQAGSRGCCCIFDVAESPQEPTGAAERARLSERYDHGAQAPGQCLGISFVSSVAAVVLIQGVYVCMYVLSTRRVCM